MTVIPLDRKTHETVQELLPWYLTQRLDANELVLVEQHLAVCARCRADLAFERRLQEELAGLPTGDRAEQGLARLRPQLLAQARAPQGRRLCRTLVAVSLVAVPAVLWGLWPAYRTLGPVAAPANLIVKLRPGIGAQEAQRHWPAGVTVVGTTVTDGWLLSVPPARRGEALERLRADAAVELAEPLDTEPSR